MQPTSFSSPSPRRLAFRRLEEELQEELRRGTWPIGSQLPNEQELAKHYGVGRHTLRRAVEELIARNLLQRRQGAGTFVINLPRDPAEDDSPAPRALSVTLLRSNYPSRRGEEWARVLHTRLQEQGHRPLTLMCSSPQHLFDVSEQMPPCDVCIVDALERGVLPLDVLCRLRTRAKMIVIPEFGPQFLDVEVVATDHAMCLALALSHLRERGHERIALASGEPEFLVREAETLFRAMERARGTAGPMPLLLARTLPGQDARAQMRSHLSDFLREQPRPPFSAMVVWSFVSALGALDALREAGLEVPRDVSLVVVDNTDLHAPECAHLTMVGATSEQIARALIERIEHRWAFPNEPFSHLIAPQLENRGSTRAVTS